MPEENFHKVEIFIPKNMSKEESEKVILNSVYKLGFIIYEIEGEHTGKLECNGHHVAQMLSEYARKLWADRVV